MFSSLQAILQEARKKNPLFSKTWNDAKAFERWPQVVGEVIAKHARPVRVLHNTLWVEVQDPIWRAELFYRKHQILEALKGGPSEEGPAIEEIEFLAPERRLPLSRKPLRGRWG